MARMGTGKRRVLDDDDDEDHQPRFDPERTNTNTHGALGLLQATIVQGNLGRLSVASNLVSMAVNTVAAVVVVVGNLNKGRFSCYLFFSGSIIVIGFDHRQRDAHESGQKCSTHVGKASLDLP